MRTTTKLKKILQKNTPGISIGGKGCSIAAISIDKPINRINLNDTLFSRGFDKPFRTINF